MSHVLLPQPVKLIVGMISADSVLFADIQEILSSKFGDIDYHSAIMDFNFTDYYYAEMGKPLFRKFVSFSPLIDPGQLPQIKLYTYEIEKRFSFKEEKLIRRRINLDPGYVTKGKLILATFKDHQHRIYLGEGVYAEVTLRYIRHSFNFWEWTYPDYRSEEYISIFNSIRQLYCEQLNKI